MLLLSGSSLMMDRDVLLAQSFVEGPSLYLSKLEEGSEPLSRQLQGFLALPPSKELAGAGVYSTHQI